MRPPPLFATLHFAVRNLATRKMLDIRCWGRFEYLLSSLSSCFCVGVYGLLKNLSISSLDSKNKQIPTLQMLNKGSCIVYMLLALFGLLSLISLEYIARPAKNNLTRFLKEKEGEKGKKHAPLNQEKPVLVCVGDSITHGQCSANYVDLIGNILKDSKKNLQIVNAGQNSICTWPVLHGRLKQIIRCEPEYISILIGSNDIKGVYRERWATQSQLRWNIPENLSFQNYQNNLRNIVEQLLIKTNAKICICTLPPMGEDLNCKANDLVRKANEIIRNEIARIRLTNKRVEIIPLFEEFEKILKKSSEDRKIFHRVEAFLHTNYWMSFCHVIFGIPLISLSKLIKNEVSKDQVHYGASTNRKHLMLL